ncbi:MAG: tRNA 2-thiocytidine biosynthesis TtcA family protein [Simkaniaceae bacterium]|nr:tRNA 2-thiocytidine biosynthesis TtcA family protein [Simkaniaceae bacterium]
MSQISMRKRLESLCRKAIHEFGLLEGQNRVGIALSGGKDSLTLLHLLASLRGRGFPNFEIFAFHVTGAFSCGAGVDNHFLKNVCEELDVSLKIMETHQSLDTLECYSCSRRRRKLIFDAAKEVGVERIAFGHHLDDHIETLLLNLMHKAEFEGNLPLVPMHRYGVTIIRPLFYIHEAEIASFARAAGFARITCQCPVGQKSRRRSVKELIGEIEEIFPNARNNLSKAAILHGSKKALECPK